MSQWSVRDMRTGAVYPQPNKMIAEAVAKMHGNCFVEWSILISKRQLRLIQEELEYRVRNAISLRQESMKFGEVAAEKIVDTEIEAGKARISSILDMLPTADELQDPENSQMERIREIFVKLRASLEQFPGDQIVLGGAHAADVYLTLTAIVKVLED